MCSRSQAARTRAHLDGVLDAVIATMAPAAPAVAPAPPLARATDMLLEAGLKAPNVQGLPDVIGDAVRGLYQPTLAEAPPADMADLIDKLDAGSGPARREVQPGGK